MVPAEKFAAYRYVLEPLVAIASPVKIAPELDMSTVTTASVLFTVEFQPDMVPSKVAKMNAAGSPVATAKPCVPL